GARWGRPGYGTPPRCPDMRGISWGRRARLRRLHSSGARLGTNHPRPLPVGFVLGTVPAVLWLVHRRRLGSRHAVVFLVAILVGELRLYQPTAHPDRYAAFAEAPYVRWLRATPDRGRVFGTEWTLFPNTASAFALDDLGIYGGLFVDRFVRSLPGPLRPGGFAAGS